MSFSRASYQGEFEFYKNPFFISPLHQYSPFHPVFSTRGRTEFFFSNPNTYLCRPLKFHHSAVPRRFQISVDKNGVFFFFSTVGVLLQAFEFRSSVGCACFSGVVQAGWLDPAAWMNPFACSFLMAFVVTGSGL